MHTDVKAYSFQFVIQLVLTVFINGRFFTLFTTGFDTTKVHFLYKSFDQTINPLLSTKRVLSRWIDVSLIFFFFPGNCNMKWVSVQPY